MKIKPTRKLILYAVVLLLSLVPAIFVNSIGGYLPFFILLLCGILSLVQLLLVKGQVRYGVSSGQDLLLRGDAVPFGIELRNRSFLPVVHMRAEFYIAGKSGMDLHEYPLQITLPPRQKKQVSLRADFPHIGSYEAGFRRLVIHDLFDNFQAIATAKERRPLDIHPNIYRMESLPVSTSSEVENSRATSASPISGMEYSGVREYAYGDPMKRIQWKLSAHSGSMMTKLMESYTNTGLTIMMDFRVDEAIHEKSRLTMLDGIVEMAASVGQYALQGGIDYILMYTDRDAGAKQCTPSSFHELRQWLPDFRLLPPGSKPASDFIEESSRGLNQQSNLVYCTGWLSDSAVTALTRIRMAGKNVIVYYLVPEDLYDQERQEFLAPVRKLQRAQIACIVGSRAEEMVH